jgi:protoporphyrin/coproporphyrin ferrochelatase
MSPPIGVLVMAHGTPAEPGDIAPFYTRIRRGRPPTPEQLAELESRYDAIGGLSPLNRVTAAQVDGLRAELEARAPGRYLIAFGAKHASPLIEDAAAALLTAGVERVIGLVLTPHGSSLGTGEYLERAAAALGAGTPLVAVTDWYAEPELVALLGQRIRDALATLTTGSANTRHPVIFTAHSLPERVRESGDTYPQALEESARLVAAAAGLDRWEVAWQSAGRTPEPWLGPDVREVVRRLESESGTDGVVVCPIGFVADHLEVLYDLDIELAAVAAEVGLPLARTASLNDDPGFIRVLADVIVSADAAGG